MPFFDIELFPFGELDHSSSPQPHAHLSAKLAALVPKGVGLLIAPYFSSPSNLIAIAKVIEVVLCIIVPFHGVEVNGCNAPNMIFDIITEINVSIHRYSSYTVPLLISHLEHHTYSDCSRGEL